jgi:peptidoglycan/xylan/chitin deacetylase (PgdA/CDA1 family)
MEGFHVLMYHEIIKKEDFDINKPSHIKVKQAYDDVLPKVLFTYLEEFEKQMKYLKDNGYKTLRLQEVIDYYYNGKEIPEKSILLTFDDMYKSIYIYAYPILKKYGFNAVGFVVLDWLFDEKQEYSPVQSACMSFDELNQISDVFEFANHTKSLHTRSGEQTIVQTIDKESFIKDVSACEEFVSSKHVFAYPFGGYNEEVIKRLKELDFKLGFTSKPGNNYLSTSPFELNRNAVMFNLDIDKYINILENN